MSPEQIALQLLLPKLIAHLKTNPKKCAGVYVDEEEGCCVLGWAAHILHPTLPITRDAFYYSSEELEYSPVQEINILFRGGDPFPSKETKEICYCKDQPCGNGFINKVIRASDSNSNWDATIKVLESGLNKSFQKWHAELDLDNDEEYFKFLQIKWFKEKSKGKSK